MSRSEVVWSRVRRWGPPVLWMMVISIFSTQAFAASETSRYIGPFLRWLFPTASNATLDAVHAAIRKGMHVSEFAILAGLWYRGLAWRQPNWQTKKALAAFLLTALFAAVDEAHQAFVPERTASPVDIAWDSLGGLCGLIGCRVLREGFWHERRTLRRRNPRGVFG